MQKNRPQKDYLNRRLIKFFLFPGTGFPFLMMSLTGSSAHDDPLKQKPVINAPDII